MNSTAVANLSKVSYATSYSYLNIVESIQEEAEWRCLQQAERLPLYCTESFGANKVLAPSNFINPTIRLPLN